MDQAFQPYPPLIDGRPHRNCRAVVIIPARNEEHTLPAGLEALRLQCDPMDRPIPHDIYEVVLLLNNCTDASPEVARRYQQEHPGFHLHIAERTLPPEAAHVGTARRLLMDTAFQRLQAGPHVHTAILSTDADTTVSRDWVYRNLRAIEDGAEAVGGVIHLKPEDVDFLDAGTLRAYRNDRLYQQHVARLESLLDPDPDDPWPRHLEHFGASLACTPAAYRRAGGLPPVKPLEDVAFVDALRRVDARLRHAPEVSIHTSARLDGRAEVGLSGQLRHWQEDSAAGRAHLVQSAESLAHRFSSLARLRRLWKLEELPELAQLPESWREPLADSHPRRLSQAAFLASIDCNRLISETFHGKGEGEIAQVIADLAQRIDSLISTSSPAHPGESVPAAATEPLAIPAG
ncbi:glycosyltransferase [Granulicella sibirica]|uniref:glycosyltransferase n=1 Tax=Granulicella sibirica TaxID=2479048 RepID=UPI0010087482|nr:glycosyltransferase [Granulicella sibirica]